jgi:hypothetical protein
LQPQQQNQAYIWKDEGATPQGPEFTANVRLEMEDLEDRKDSHEL